MQTPFQRTTLTYAFPLSLSCKQRQHANAYATKDYVYEKSGRVVMVQGKEGFVIDSILVCCHGCHGGCVCVCVRRMFLSSLSCV